MNTVDYITQEIPGKVEIDLEVLTLKVLKPVCPPFWLSAFNSIGSLTWYQLTKPCCVESSPGVEKGMRCSCAAPQSLHNLLPTTVSVAVPNTLPEEWKSQAGSWRQPQGWRCNFQQLSLAQHFFPFVMKLPLKHVSQFICEISQQCNCARFHWRDRLLCARGCHQNSVPHVMAFPPTPRASCSDGKLTQNLCSS